STPSSPGAFQAVGITPRKGKAAKKIVLFMEGHLQYSLDLEGKISLNGCFTAHNGSWGGDPHIKKFFDYAKGVSGFGTDIKKGSGEGISVRCRGEKVRSCLPFIMQTHYGILQTRMAAVRNTGKKKGLVYSTNPLISFGVPNGI
ncbi:MAG: hypothetical protein WA974_01735, partial [Thermodesulfobacteriota bacterium]